MIDLILNNFPSLAGLLELLNLPGLFEQALAKVGELLGGAFQTSSSAAGTFAGDSFCRMFPFIPNCTA